jgi:hypothetical protein
MEGLRNTRGIGCGEGDHVSNGCWNSGGKADEAFTTQPEDMRVGLIARGERFSTVSRGGRRGAEKR